MAVKNHNTSTNHAVVAQREDSNNEAIPVVTTAVLLESRATKGETTPVSRDSKDLKDTTAVLATPLPAPNHILLDSPTTPALFRVQSFVEAPKNMKVTRPGNQDEQIIVIERKWRYCLLVFFMLYCTGTCIYLAQLVNFYLMSDAWSWAMFGLSIFVDLIAICSIYAFLTTLLNSTFVTVENGASSSSIVVEDRPMFRRKKTMLLSRNDIQEVCCSSTSPDEYGAVDYDVLYIDAHSGEHHVIVGGLPSREEALFFAQEIQVALGVNVVADGQLAG
jgi:hypothetical protein